MTRHDRSRELFFKLGFDKDLAGSLDLVRNLVWSLDGLHGSSRIQNLGARPLFIRVCEDAKRLASDLDDTHCRAGEYNFDRSVITGLGRAIDRARLIERLLDEATSVAEARSIQVALARVPDLAIDVEGILYVLINDADRRTVVPSEPSPKAPAASAAQLARGAVRVLPAAARGRYRAEFDSELYELALAGVSRWAQFLYGLRLLDRAWVLRAELREAALRGRAVRS
ncbi:hypothetical protein AB0M02_32190 [Actinoplanes sp. NPDC051861]|uniref:hypothetical protein n=1 Tax=Actinoplanes sp. NPDC051861 TaxID=3155170 RepID=UPI003439389B